MEKETLYEYIIYKIFTSKYKDLFVLDGSYGLHLTVNSKNKRKLGDLDLNELILTNSNGEKEANWDEIVVIFRDIFKNNDIQLQYKYQNVERREYNANSIGVKIQMTIDGNLIPIDMSIIFDSNGVIQKTWKIKGKNFTKKIDVVDNKNIQIKTFENEKYWVNKILSLMKLSREFNDYDKNLSKNLYDMWFILISGGLDYNKIASHFKVMFPRFKNLENVYSKLQNYLQTYYELDQDMHWLEWYIKKNSDNRFLYSAMIFNTILKHIEKLMKTKERN